MKRFQAQIAENSVTYWPYREAGIAGLIFLGIMQVVFIAISIDMLCANISVVTRIAVLIVEPIIISFLSIAFIYNYRRMPIKIVVSDIAIKWFNKNDAMTKCLAWTNVAAVYFHRNPWYQITIYKIFVTEPLPCVELKNVKSDYALPVSDDIVPKIATLIPEKLQKNKPWFV